MQGDKWHTVPSKKGTSKANNATSSKKNPVVALTRLTGLGQSDAPFSQYAVTEEVEVVGAAETLFETAASKGTGSTRPTTQQHKNEGQNTGRKRTASKKPSKQQKKLTFEECLDELKPAAIKDLMEQVQLQYTENQLNVLKEVQGYLQGIFSKAEPEKDYNFSNHSPGYPLNALPSTCHDLLMKVVAQCPPLTQENAFRYFVDLLLGELGAGTNTYGTRIVLQLLIECNHSVCVEAGELMKLHLRTNISKVPEVLSLLWVGLPHPSRYPFQAMQLWPDLCLPLFQMPNVPKQVFNYAVNYTTLLIRNLDVDEDALSTLLSPVVVYSLLESQQLVHKRAQKDVQELLSLVKGVVLRVSSEIQLAKHFKTVFQHLSMAQNAVMTEFAIECLQRSGKSWEMWSRLSPSSPASSVLLFKELKDMELGPLPLSVDKVGSSVAGISKSIPAKEKYLAKDFLTAYVKEYSVAAGRAKGARGKAKVGVAEKGMWCSVCGLLLLVTCLLYLAFVVFVFHHIATYGPEGIISEVNKFVKLSAMDIHLVWKEIASLLDQFCAAVLEYIPQSRSKLLFFINQFFAGITKFFTTSLS